MKPKQHILDEWEKLVASSLFSATMGAFVIMEINKYMKRLEEVTINKPEKYILDEWKNIVKNAKLELRDERKLIEDETIVQINKYIKRLEKRR